MSGTTLTPPLTGSPDLLGALAHWARVQPGAPACVDEQGRWTWDVFFAAVRKAARALRQLAGEASDGAAPPVIGVLMDNSAQFAIATCAIAATGATFELFPADLDDATVTRLIEGSSVRIVIADAWRIAPETTTATSQATTQTATQANPGVGDATQYVPQYVTLDQLWDQLWDQPPAAPLPPFEPDTSAFSIVYSSGTTGTPKAIAHPQAARAAVNQAAGGLGINSGAVNLVSLPMFNNLALVTWLPALANGGCNVILRRFEPAPFCAAVESHGATHFVLSPHQYRMLLAFDRLPGYRLSSLKLHISSSSRLAAAEKAAIAARLPGQFCEIYGVTEGGVGTLLRAADTAKLHTVGKPMAMYDMKIIGDDGREAAQGEVGLIVGHSAFMMSRYPDPRHAPRYWENPLAVGRRYFVPGDLGFFDADGYLQVLDRAVDARSLGGQSWFPSQIEADLQARSGCTELAVRFGGDDQDGPPFGLTVYWVGPDGDPAALRQALQAHYPQFAPTLVRCAGLPRNAMGKLMRHQLMPTLHESQHA